jgi:NADPH:quinone reductase-like Zn-dependent oxidoreductase
MEKIVIHRPGHYDRLTIERHATPPVGPNRVHIAVEAAGVNYADCVVRMGLYSSAKRYVGWPITPGFEVAGRVERIGPGVEDLTVGDPVMAVTRFGGYATDVVVPRRFVFDRPPGWSAVQAAAFPAAHLTAYYALCELARLQPGAHVLVHSAAGGVGGVLCRLARRLDLQVVGVVGSAHKVAEAERQGAHVVIDKSNEDLWARAELHAPAGYDAIFDANGLETLRHSYRHLRPTGRLVIYGFATMLPRGGRKVRWWRLAWNWLCTPRFDPIDLTDKNRSVMGFNLSYLFDHTPLLHQAMAQLQEWTRDGTLVPSPITTYPLADAAAAHRDLESGATVGKLVLVTGPAGETPGGRL